MQVVVIVLVKNETDLPGFNEISAALSFLIEGTMEGHPALTFLCVFFRHSLYDRNVFNFAVFHYTAFLDYFVSEVNCNVIIACLFCVEKLGDWHVYDVFPNFLSGERHRHVWS
jgi:hypothetical protein